MTNALALNSENTTDVILNALTQSAQVQDKNAAKDISSNANFNNVLNNLNSKTKSAQSDLEKTVLKSNTSSINKEALNPKETSRKAIKFQRENLEQKTDVRQQKTTDVNAKEDINAIQTQKNETTKDTIKVENNVSSDTNELEAKTEIEENNNSSFPSPSPVFSSKEDVQTEVKDINEIEKVISQVEELLGSITLTQDIELDIDSDIVSEIEDKISQITSLEEINTTVEEITNFLNNTDLNNQEKDAILADLKELQDLLANKNTENVDFENVLSELKTKLTDTIKDTLFDVTKQIKAQDLAQSAEKLSTNLEKLETILKEENKELFKEIEKQIEDISQKLEKVENVVNDEKIINNDDEIKKINEKVEALISKLENKETVDLKEVENIRDLFKTISNDIEKNIEIDTKAQIKTTQEVEIELDTETKTIVSNNLEKLDEIFADKEITKDETKDLSEILDVFENLAKEEIKLDDEIKTEIKKVISELDKNIDTIDVADIQKQSANIVSQLKNLIEEKDETTINTEEDIVLNTQNEVDNSQKIDFEIKDQKTITSTNQDLKPEVQEAQELEKEIEINLEESVDFEVKLNETKITTKDVENLDKKSFIQNTLQDMLIDIDYEAPSAQSSTLTVSDELVKMAIDEPTNLNIDTTFKGSVVYDPASNNASVIKNINLAKTLQTPQNFELEQNNVLGQITDKIQQMKDGSNARMTLVLRPNDLGRLSIELSTNHLGLTTNILAQNEDVRNYIEKNIDALKQQLSEAGVNVNTIQIKTAGQEGSSTYEGNNHFAQQQNENNNQQNQNQKQDTQQQKAKQEYITSLGGYDFQDVKDFSSILNHTMNYIN
ncbi:MAG: flagellar hook-length control protein FliK [Candidatus Gastranaerophilales bacterium]|nr:flagellar hook-length control protein FliK [Candidatus Gastranaerophilales bacterium]